MHFPLGGQLSELGIVVLAALRQVVQRRDKPLDGFRQHESPSADEKRFEAYAADAVLDPAVDRGLVSTEPSRDLRDAQRPVEIVDFEKHESLPAWMNADELNERRRHTGMIAKKKGGM